MKRLLRFLREAPGDYRVIAAVATLLLSACLYRMATSGEPLVGDSVAEAASAKNTPERLPPSLASLPTRVPRHYRWARDGRRDPNSYPVLPPPGDFLGDLLRAFESGHLSGLVQLEGDQRRLFARWRRSLGPEVLRRGLAIKKVTADAVEEDTEFHDFSVAHTSIRGRLGVRRVQHRWHIVAALSDGPTEQDRDEHEAHKNRLLELLRTNKRR